MGALRKAIEKLVDLVKLDRGKTSWAKDGTPEAGFTRFPHDWLDDSLWRIAKEGVQERLIIYGWRLTCGMAQSKSDPLPEWTPWVSIKALQEKVHCKWTDSVWDGLRNARDRGAIAMEERGRSEVRYRILHRNWPKMLECAKCGEVHLPNLPCPPKAGPKLVDDKPKPKPSGEPWSMAAGGGERKVRFEIPLEELTVRNRDSEGGMMGQLVIGSTGRPELEFWRAKPKDKKKCVENKREVADFVDSTPASGVGFLDSTPAKTFKIASDPASEKLDFSSPLAAVLAKFGILSDLSVQKLIADCQTWAPECSIDEIVEAAAGIGAVAAASPKTRNVAGIVLTQVPEYFKNPAGYQSGAKPWLKKPALSARQKHEQEVIADAERRLAERRRSKHG